MEENKKQYFKVKLLVMAPVEQTLKVLAETPEQAIELVSKGQHLERPKPILSKSKKIRITVYKYGTNTIELEKSY